MDESLEMHSRKHATGFLGYSDIWLIVTVLTNLTFQYNVTVCTNFSDTFGTEGVIVSGEICIDKAQYEGGRANLCVRVGLLLGAVGQREVLGVADHDVQRVAPVLEGQLELALDPARGLALYRGLLV